ncbi:MAG: DNA topoisomerase IB [Anaerolineae bacterium]|nr:DNA topoisomerase IB [Anaerolineae bacterium]
MPRRPPLTEAEKTARLAKLRYITDTEPGIHREKSGDEFVYVNPDGRPIKDMEEISRIQQIGIPPAWTEVWICPDPNGHILAVGRDEKGRKQYRYHPDWSSIRSSNKFGRMAAFGAQLPIIRETAATHLRKHALSREKVLALVITLLETTLIRIGNREYVRANNSFGLTTLHDQHAKISDHGVKFQFKGKSGQKHVIQVEDKQLARAIKACRDIPGQLLFQYYDDADTPHPITSTDVNAYLREITGQEFSAKDFRTWGGSVFALAVLYELPPGETEHQSKITISQCVKEVAHHLGNTPAVCRKYYVHPAVLDAWTQGKLKKIVDQQPEPQSPFDLNAFERALLDLIGSSSGNAN